MIRAAILIGVNQVKGLPTLNEAVRGAKQMHEWVLTQGYSSDHVVLITDENELVSASKVQEAISRLLDPMAGVEQLLIYFAGHGLNINYGEFWLLSNGQSWATESVDVARSALLARYCSVPHVIFISDACRTAAVGVQQQHITGSPIFPLETVSGTEKAVDQFFACTLGKPALEIKNQDEANAATFVALYTEALLAVLKGQEPTIIEVASDGEMPAGVIRPWPLKQALEKRVANVLVKSGQYTRISQTPDARITSNPQVAWIARLELPPPSGPVSRNNGSMNFSVRAARDFGRTSPDQPKLGLPSWVNLVLNSLLFKIGLPLSSSNEPAAQELLTQAIRQSKEFGPLSFATQCGVKLRGALAKEAVCSGVRVEWVVEGESLQAYLQPSQSNNRVMLILHDGSGVMVPLLPGFIAELSFDDGLCVGLAYEISENAPLDESNLAKRLENRFLREFVVAAAERGVFQPDQQTLRYLTEKLLDAPGPDPMLWLFLAYALDDAGMIGLLRSLIGALREINPLFDVVLLANRPGEEQDELSGFSPGMPLLARGWTGLSARPGRLSKELGEISRMRHSSMWTHFTSDAIHIFRQQFRPPEVDHHA